MEKLKSLPLAVKSNPELNSLLFSLSLCSVIFCQYSFCLMTLCCCLPYVKYILCPFVSLCVTQTKVFDLCFIKYIKHLGEKKWRTLYRNLQQHLKEIKSMTPAEPDNRQKYYWAISLCSSQHLYRLLFFYKMAFTLFSNFNIY